MDKKLKVARRRSNWIVVMAALGFTGYTAYRVYHFPSIARKREKISKFFVALSSAAAAFSDSADCVATVSRDLKEFLHSDSDEIPLSFKQISKLARSDEISDSFTRLSQALTLGVLRGYDQYSRQHHGGGGGGGDNNSSNFTDKIMAKLCSESGSGFVSVVVGSFARNLVMAFLSMDETSKSASSRFEDRLARWMGMVGCDEKCKELIGELIRIFVSSAVSIYLEKTMELNAFDQIFSGLTNPKHEKEMRELLVSLSNGAVKTLIRTSHQVLSSGHGNWAIEPGPGPASGKKMEEMEDIEMGLKPRSQIGRRPRNGGGWTSKSRKVMVKLTGRMTFEMVRSFIEVLLEKIYEGMKRSVDIVNEEVIERGMEMVRYVAAKTSVIASVCLSFCLYVLDTSSWFLLAY